MKIEGPGYVAHTFGDRPLPTAIDDDIDIHMDLPNREGWVATFYTVERLQSIAKLSAVDGFEDYFPDRSMVIVRDFSFGTIKAALDDIVAKGRVPWFFEGTCSEAELEAIDRDLQGEM